MYSKFDDWKENKRSPFPFKVKSKKKKKKIFGAMKGKIRILGDIISPIDDWEPKPKS